eukprot:8391368-Pyramimonas_sp.AAC.1
MPLPFPHARKWPPIACEIWEASPCVSDKAGLRWRSRTSGQSDFNIPAVGAPLASLDLGDGEHFFIGST